VHTLGDAHLYSNHITQAKLQLTRQEYNLPFVVLNQYRTDIDSFKIEDVKLIGYRSHKRIKAPVAI